MSLTRTQFQEAVQNYLDSTGTDANASATVSTPRWDKATINAVGGNVCNEEWSGILNQNPYFRFNTVSVTTSTTSDSTNGSVAVSALTTGSGDTKKYFYRILTGFTDGTYLYKECDYRNVPLATTTNYQTPWDYLYYLAGDNFQILPVASGTALTVAVNWTPPRVDQLATDSSVIDFPDGSEYILVWQTAAKLMLKGGAEAGAAQALTALADNARTNLYGSIARLTTRPSYLLYQDIAQNWGA